MRRLKERLDKFIASQCGVSRSDAARAIRGGRVSVANGAVRDPSLKIDPSADEVGLDGRAVVYRKHLYIMMNKPAGLLCVSRDNRVRTVIDMLPGELRRSGLFPAGRLDKDTTGLVIITDDGDFAHRMLSPRHDVEKTYHAVLDAPVGDAEIAAFAEGIRLEDGTLCRPASLHIISNDEQPLVEIRITEGKYHQIKRMAAALERRVVLLKRTAIGRLFLDDTLKEGECRELTGEEIKLLFER